MSLVCGLDCRRPKDNESTAATYRPVHDIQIGVNHLHVVFHEPIQTIHREKEPNKWYNDMINVISTLGQDINEFNEFGEAPLGVAASKAQGFVIEDLLQREGINVNIVGKRGRTPLFIAAEEGHVYIAKLLLQHPTIDVNKRNFPGDVTPLMAASRRGHSRVVELLLQHPDIEVDLKDKDGETALNHARSASVKFRLHHHSNRSRSLENVVSRNRPRSKMPVTTSSDIPSTSSTSSPSPVSPLQAQDNHSLSSFHTNSTVIEASSLDTASSFMQSSAPTARSSWIDFASPTILNHPEVDTILNHPEVDSPSLQPLISPSLYSYPNSPGWCPPSPSSPALASPGSLGLASPGKLYSTSPSARAKARNIFLYGSGSPDCLEGIESSKSGPEANKILQPDPSKMLQPDSRLEVNKILQQDSCQPHQLVHRFAPSQRTSPSPARDIPRQKEKYN